MIIFLSTIRSLFSVGTPYTTAILFYSIAEVHQVFPLVVLVDFCLLHNLFFTGNCSTHVSLGSSSVGVPCAVDPAAFDFVKA